MASPARGRFRALLLSAVANFMRDDHRRRTAGHRLPPSRRWALRGPALMIADPSASPEVAFTSAWVAMLVGEAAERLRKECLRDGREAHWICFEGRVLNPALRGDAPASSDSLRQRTGLATIARVAHAIAAMKRRFAAILLETMGQATDEPHRLREELGELLQLLERRS